MTGNKTLSGNTPAVTVPKDTAQTALGEDIQALKAQLAAAEAELETQRALTATAENLAATATEEKARVEEEKRVATEELKALSAKIDNEVSKQEEVIKRQMRGQRKVRIRLNSGRDANERGAVAVAVNGREYLIKRDEEVDVPEGVLNVLNLAVEQAPVTVDESGQARVVFRDTLRFSYAVVGYINPETGTLEK